MNIEKIIKIVSEESGISVKDITSQSRRQDRVLARHLSMWACRWYSGSSLQKIAGAHNRVQHGSVIHASNAIEDAIRFDKRIAELQTRILIRLK
jgi:chromosomal replication initiation ATPase DnaA